MPADLHPRLERPAKRAKMLEDAITAAILSAYRVPPDVLPAMVERVADAVRPDAPAEREQPTWLLDLVHAVETAAGETGCNFDHEGSDGCDGCAWAGLVEAVPVRLRNAADEHASKGGAW